MYTVVVADDEAEIRGALIRRVDWEAAGFKVVGEAENGAEALEMVELLEPDLLLTDIKMPFLSGIELAREVREIRPVMQIAFLSGYEDFEYAKQAIQYNVISYMLKPISLKEISAELKKIKRKIDQKFHEFAFAESREERLAVYDFLVPLILDSVKRSEEETALVEQAISSGFIKGVIESQQYVILTTSILDEHGRKCRVENTVQAFNALIKKYFKFYFSFAIDGRVISILAATETVFDRYLHILAEDMIQNVERIMDLSGRIGISRPVKNFSDCHEAYKEAMHAQQYATRYGDSISYISDVEYRSEFDIGELLTSVGEIEKMFRSGTQEELNSCLDQFFSELKMREVSPTVFQLITIQLVAVIFRVSYSLLDNEEIQQLQEAAPFAVEELRFAKIEQAWEEYRNFCIFAKELMLNKRKTSSILIIEKALSIIDEQCSDPSLSLIGISGMIGVTPTYLSALVKKETGSRFIDLLTKSRIEKAKELLMNTSMKIKEVSLKCGYNDQHYFSYCFKKHTGMSPNACRRKNESKENEYA